MGLHIPANMTVFDGLLRTNAGKFYFKSICVFLTITFRQDDPCPQRTKTSQGSHVICEFGSVVCATAGAFCENCSS